MVPFRYCPELLLYLEEGDTSVDFKLRLKTPIKLENKFKVCFLDVFKHYNSILIFSSFAISLVVGHYWVIHTYSQHKGYHHYHQKRRLVLLFASHTFVVQQNKVVRWFFVMLTHWVKKKFVFSTQNGADLAGLLCRSLFPSLLKNFFFSSWPSSGIFEPKVGA